MTMKIRDQILAVRDSGRTNMFDLCGVQRVAFDLALHDLVLYLDDRQNRSEYSRFIMTGEATIEEEGE